MVEIEVGLALGVELRREARKFVGYSGSAPGFCNTKSQYTYVDNEHEVAVHSDI
jgi:hypothetical protein